MHGKAAVAGVGESKYYQAQTHPGRGQDGAKPVTMYLPQCSAVGASETAK